MCLQKLINIWKTPKGAEVTMNDISLALVSQLGGVQNSIYLDGKYKTKSFDEIAQIIYENKGDKEIYVSDYYDCDDFAIALFGHFKSKPETSHIPFGLCFVKTSASPHAINIFYADDGKLYMVEPQTDEIWLVGSSHSDYDPYFVMI